MKKLVVVILGIAALGVSGTVGANNAPETNTNNPELTASSRVSHMTSMINDIAVPMEVLIYAQTQYQGYAVTQATKIIRDGNQAYRLRVDRDDIPTDYESFYLIYDMNWKLLGEEKTVPPPPKPAPAKQETKKPEKKPEKPEQPEPQTNNDPEDHNDDDSNDDDRQRERPPRRENNEDDD